MHVYIPVNKACLGCSVYKCGHKSYQGERRVMVNILFVDKLIQTGDIPSEIGLTMPLGLSPGCNVGGAFEGLSSTNTVSRL